MAYEVGAGPFRDRTAERSIAPARVVPFPVPTRRDIAPAIDIAPPDLARGRSAFPELDCVRHRLSLGIIAAAERRAISLGVGADRVLIAGGVLEEDEYTIALARWLGWEYESFEHCSRETCPLDDQRLLEAARVGLLPLVSDGQLVIVVAPRSVRQLLEFARRQPALRFRLTSSLRLNGFIKDFAAKSLGEEAADGLQRRRPDLSAGARDTRSWLFLVPLVTVLTGLLLAFPAKTIALIETVLAGCFLSWLALRLFGSFLSPAPARRVTVADADLPVYSLIVALYREANSVEALVAALRALDYPGIMAQTPQAVGYHAA